jgi:hypothetical protein
MGSKLVTLKRTALANRLGLVRLSETPEDPLDPVAVAENDPRLPAGYPDDTDQNGLAVFSGARDLEQFAGTGILFTEDGVVASLDPRPDSMLATDENGSPVYVDLANPDAVEIYFSWGDATPRIIHTMTKTQRVWEVRLSIETVFDGTGPSLQIGDAGDPGRLMGATQNDPLSLAIYSSSPGAECVAGSDILLTITPGGGASQGSGHIQLIF